ncbi:MAG: 30S ribosomal protein S17 [Mycoplasmataceae bacterium]|nr:30S ribosomal protein S17 [Mycoplasmataceae bacterium]
MERHNAKQVYQGYVVSDKQDKTIVVRVDTYRMHPLYGKRVKYSKKLQAHDENNEATMNDIVRIMQTKPLSKNKNFRLIEVVEKRN